MSKRNGADYGIEPTRKTGPAFPLIYDRASRPVTTERGDIQGFAILSSKNNPPEGWMVSTPSKHPGKRWYWIFLLVPILLLILPEMLK